MDVDEVVENDSKLVKQPKDQSGMSEDKSHPRKAQVITKSRLSLMRMSEMQCLAWTRDHTNRDEKAAVRWAGWRRGVRAKAECSH